MPFIGDGQRAIGGLASRVSRKTRRIALRVALDAMRDVNGWHEFNPRISIRRDPDERDSSRPVVETLLSQQTRGYAETREDD